jgi:geranylgeranyl diphosphate synthase type I
MSDSTEIDAFFSAELAGMRREFEEQLNRSLSTIVSRIDNNLDVEVIHRCILDYFKKPGKRLRPLLFLSTVQALNPEQPIDSGGFQMACGLEFFHEFILIHDDLIDRSDTRRGAPTLWRRLELDAGLPESRARSTALIIGDILFAYSIELFSSNDTPPSITSELLGHFLWAARETGWGAIGEIVVSEQPFLQTATGTVEAIYHAKTTRYTFETPMLLAAEVCRAPDLVQTTLVRMARPLGLAFQLENDLHELTGYLGGRPARSADTKSGLKTLPLVRLLEILPDRHRQEMAVCLDQPNSEDRRERLAEALEKTRFIPVIRSEIDLLFGQTVAILQQSGIDADLRGRLAKIVGFLRTHRKHSEAVPKNDDLRTKE